MKLFRYSKISKLDYPLDIHKTIHSLAHRLLIFNFLEYGENINVNEKNRNLVSLYIMHIYYFLHKNPHIFSKTSMFKDICEYNNHIIYSFSYILYEDLAKHIQLSSFLTFLRRLKHITLCNVIFFARFFFRVISIFESVMDLCRIFYLKRLGIYFTIRIFRLYLRCNM